MKMQFFSFICLLIFINFSLACSHKERQIEINQVQENIKRNSKIHDKLNFDSCIAIIDKKLGKAWDWPEGIMLDSTFQELYQNPQSYYDDATEFLYKSKFTYRQSLICLYSMENLGINNYVKFCDTLFDLFNKNKISESLLSVAILRDFMGKFNIIQNYNDSSIQILLQNIMTNKKISNQLKNNIPEILSGKSWANEEEYLKKDLN